MGGPPVPPCFAAAAAADSSITAGGAFALDGGGTELAPEGDPSFYFCGPDAFMGRALSLLHRRGVSSERIHYEFFGPLQALQAA